MIESWKQVEFVGNVEGKEQWDIFVPYDLDWDMDDHKSCEPDTWALLADQAAMNNGDIRCISYSDVCILLGEVRHT